MKDKRTNKLKAFLSTLLGINEWKLNSDGHLDVKPEDLTRLKEKYGEDFVPKFEKLLAEEEIPSDRIVPKGTKQSKSDMLKLEMLCALLAIEGFTLSEDGNVSMSKEQLDKIEAGLKQLQDDKAAAETNLTTANTAKETAVNALNAATEAMDKLDTTVAAAKTPAEKVEAIRTKLASKPAVAPIGAISPDGKTDASDLDGKDEINAYAKQFKS